MRRSFGLTLAFAGTLVAVGCGGSGPTGLATGGSGAAQITVTSGVTPNITWTGGAARRISVINAAGGGVFWDIEALNPQQGFTGPVTYGVVPNATRENSNDAPLTQGTDFRVNVTLVNGSEGTRVFRP